MINILKPLSSGSSTEQVRGHIATYYDEARQLLPDIPADINIFFDDSVMIQGYGTGGFAFSPTTLTIAFDETFKDKASQRHNLKATIFHEAYHLAQGYTGETFDGTALDEAVLEGMATVFEREKAGSNPPWGVYSDMQPRRLKELIVIFANLHPDWSRSKWKFFNEDTGEKWLLYRVGTYLADTMMINSGKDVTELTGVTAHDYTGLIPLSKEEGYEI